MIRAAPDTLPYPGLRPFSRSESMLFFGRDGCIDDMIERLAATRFLAVLGASGSGKSSLVRTGLFDGLELGFFARAGARWRIVETHPGGAPMRHLAEALARSGDDGDLPEDVETLLRRGRRSLIEWAGGGRLAPGENLLILVDQFEELFRYGDFAAREEAEDFVKLLIESARALELPIYILVTMRSEYLGACALIPGLAEQVNAGFYLTPRMEREGCREAIEGPAAVMGFAIEAALTDRILNDMAGFAPWEEERGVVQAQILSRRADQLPLMQHLLNRLWLRASEAGGTDIVLRVADYEAVGGLVGALDAHGREVLASLAPADRAAAPTVFRALVSGPDPTNAVRRPSRLGAIDAELAASGAGAVAAAPVVEAFRAFGCNFLQPDPAIPLAAGTLVDISHESLIRQWSVLSTWLEEEARAGANWQRLIAAADRYEAGAGDLMSGVDLATVRQWWETERPNAVWAERHGGQFASGEAFLERSGEAEAERTTAVETRAARDRRGRLVVGALLVAVVPSVLLTGYTATRLAGARASVEQLVTRGRQLDLRGERLKREQARIQGENAAQQTALKILIGQTASAHAELETATQAKTEAEIKATEASRALADSSLSLESMKRGNRLLIETNPEASDFVDIMSKVLDACRARPKDDPVCIAAGSDDPAGK